MNPFDISDSLKKFVEITLNDFQTSCLNPNTGLFQRRLTEIIKIDRADGRFKFEFLGKYFLIDHEIVAVQNFCLLKTYEIVTDVNDYEKKKLNYISGMDIQISLPIGAPNYFRFREDIIKTTIAGKDKEGNPIPVSTNVSAIANFTNQYLNRLFEILNETKI